MRRKLFFNRYIKGIAALEVMVAVVIIIAIFSIAVPIFLHTQQVNRTNITYKKLIRIKNAIVGDSSVMVEKKRASFGFVGDLGILPVNLDELLSNSTGRPPYQRYLTTGMFYGWKGPYLKDSSSIKDAWGDDIVYAPLSPPVSDANGLRIMEIRSTNLDSSRTIYIYREEVSCFVSGAVVTRLRPHQPIPTESGSLDIFYPNGSTVVQQGTFSITGGTYNTQGTNIRIPVGHRHFQLQGNVQQKLATLNGGGDSVVNFVTLTATTPPVSWERTFDATDDVTGNPFISGITPSGGQWNIVNGNLVANGPVGEYRAFFIISGSNDYRVEADATLSSSRGYGIYYRCDGQANVSGYCFQYDPGLGSGANPMAFVVRKVYNGGEQNPFQRVNRTAAQFPFIYNTSHHVSITVQGPRHIIRVDGSLIMDFNDNSFLTGTVGVRSWDGGSLTQFHHILVHGIPPLPNNEIAWWSFEEGNNSNLGNIVFGSGFLNDPAVVENNGAFGPGVTRTSPGIYGCALSLNGSGQVVVPNASNLNPSNQITIEAWVRTTNDNNNSNPVFKGIPGARGQGLIQNNSNSPVNGGWNAQVQTSSGVLTLCWGLRRPAENTWYHLAVTYDGVTVRFYVDGVQRSSVPASGIIVSNIDNLIIGQGFQGIIDEVFYYSRALSAAEVSARSAKYFKNR